MSLRKARLALQGGAPGTARAAAPYDMTGYWVSEVTEKWRYRMVVPDKGDYVQVPLNPEGRKVANAWDPARDQASGEACKSYGAAALLQVPGRLHISWQDDSTLRLDTDSGTQTRLFRFGAVSVAECNAVVAGTFGGDVGRRPNRGTGATARAGQCRMRRAGWSSRRHSGRKRTISRWSTTRMRPGYLQKNGVPYSGDALLEEYFDTFSDPYTRNTWLVVTTVVTDPRYLIEPLIMHAHFKKLPDASGWDPTPCRADEPR